LDEKIREVKELMELYTQKMEEIEDVKNDEEVFHQFIIINIILFVYRL
jgi:hypothetical protein